MKKTLLLALMSLLSLNIACTSQQREEDPIDEAGEEMKDVGDEAKDAID